MARPPFLDDESILRLIKTAVGGAHDTIALTNSTISGQTEVITKQQAILMAANAEVARLSGENAELRRASLERDRVVAMVDVERERMQRSDRRLSEMLHFAKDLGINILTHAMTHAPQAPVELPAGETAAEVENPKGIAHRLVMSLSKETIATIRAEAGDELVAASPLNIAQ